MIVSVNVFVAAVLLVALAAIYLVWRTSKRRPRLVDYRHGYLVHKIEIELLAGGGIAIRLPKDAIGAYHNVNLDREAADILIERLRVAQASRPQSYRGVN